MKAFVKEYLLNRVQCAMGDLETLASEFGELGMDQEKAECYRLLNKVGALTESLPEQTED